jgi:membrane-associated phospholipid phosphatase
VTDPTNTAYSRSRRPRRRVRRTRAALIAVLATALLHAASTRAAAQEVVQPWQHLGDTLAGIYGWPNVLFHVAAVAVTPPLVYTADKPVHEYFKKYPLADEFGQAAYVAGWTVPIGVPATLYVGGLLAHDPELATAGAAAIQAIVLQAVVVSTLKWLTDRATPGNSHAKRLSSGFLDHDSNDPTDFDFNPFNLSGGVNWPSGHTASMFALVSTLVAYYPDEIWLAVIGYPIALAVGVGMIEANYHWVSDVVAGALIGHIIGWVTGKQFRSAFDAQRSRARDTTEATSVQLRVLPTPRGLMLAGAF